jgi:hypothetical protein
MNESYQRKIYDGHELDIPTRLIDEKPGNRVMKFLLNPSDWLARNQHLCIIGLAVCICIAFAL